MQGIDIGRLRTIVEAALDEDLGEAGDRTTRATVPAGARARGRILAREWTVVAGNPVAREVFLTLDPSLRWNGLEDGAETAAGEEVARVEGAARPILTGERTALNFLQRLCGIASMTRRAVREVEGTRAVILDTRKTTPSLRALEKYAVAMGGGANHRMGLHDAVLIKDNHVALAGGVAAAVRRAIGAGIRATDIEVEVDDLQGLEEALAAGVGRILLDNFTPAQAAEAARRTAGAVPLECSGGLVPGRLRPYAEAGVRYLSLGSLTHSARAADLALEIEPLR